MLHKTLPIAFFAILFTVYSCDSNEVVPATALSAIPLIPVADSIVDVEGSLDLSSLEGLRYGADAEGMANYFAESTNWFPGKADTKSVAEDKPAIHLINDASLSEEAYTLEVLPKGVEIKASSPAGYFYGLQTLRQFVEAASKKNGRLAYGKVMDSPRFGYRGIMLDIARHYLAPQEIRRVIDLVAQYKINTLHLHLTDDQGWRIEIKSWPRLTEYGGSSQVGGKSGGFLTQEDYKDLVAYAKTRFITIVPEIDMPGHTNAALASYPELNCNPKDPNPKLYEGTEVGFSTFCIGKPIVMEFVTDVLTELAAITPGPYLHVGGDESHVTDSTDYRKFIADVEPVVRKLGKRMIGWDEVVTANLDQSAVVQIWNSEENAKLAADRGHKVIMSPAKFTYLDMQYDSTSRIGLHWASYIEVDKGYIWDPGTVLNKLNDEDILGIEAPLWSETVVERADIDYLMFPRVLGYSEIGWSAPARRNWDTYKLRLAQHADRLDAQRVSFYRSPKVDWVETKSPGGS